MNSRHATFILLTLVSASQIIADEPDPTHRFLLFTAQGPLVLELSVKIDGKPLGTERHRMINEMLSAADTNRDGKTKLDEALASDKFQIGSLKYFALKKPKSFRRRLSLLDENEDGAFDFDEASRLWLLYGGADELVSFSTRSLVSYRSPASFVPYLFACLDANQDKELSAEEIKGAGDLIQRQDSDDNETLELREFAKFGKHAGVLRQAIVQQAYPTIVKLEANVTNEVSSFLKKLSQQKSKAPFFQKLQESLDNDQNGELTDEEIAALSKLAPQIVVKVQLGSGASKRPELISKGIMRLANDSFSGSATALNLDGLQLQFLAGRNLADFDIDARAKTLFVTFDRDKNGFLELAEVEQDTSVGYEADFVSWDADGDNQVTLDEITNSYREQSRRQRQSLTILNTPRSASLWNLLDINVDGKLSLREMKSLNDRLKHSDRDGDGKVTINELAQIMTLRMLPGQTSIPVRNRFAFGHQIGNLPIGPEWFVRMDRNQDGDLSRREFLGPPEEFTKMDKDKDGLIDSIEAAKKR